MMPLAVAWLPAEEYADWPACWPDLADSDLVRNEEEGGSVTHAVYCQRSELRLRDLQDAGATWLLIAPLRAAEFSRWRADRDPDDEDPGQLRAQYAAYLAQQTSLTIPWPPGRNERCWCGSDRKYKQCCGAPA